MSAAMAAMGTSLSQAGVPVSIMSETPVPSRAASAVTPQRFPAGQALVMDLVWPIYIPIRRPRSPPCRVRASRPVRTVSSIVREDREPGRTREARIHTVGAEPPIPPALLLPALGRIPRPAPRPAAPPLPRKRQCVPAAIMFVPALHRPAPAPPLQRARVPLRRPRRSRLHARLDIPVRYPNRALKRHIQPVPGEIGLLIRIPVPTTRLPSAA